MKTSDLLLMIVSVYAAIIAGYFLFEHLTRSE